MLLMPFSINSATTYSTGVGTVEFNGKCKDNRPRSKDDHFKAIEKAKKAAWDKYTGKFSAEKMSNYMANSRSFVSELDKYITEYAILETDCSKSRRVYTVAIKASINSTMVDVTLAQYNSSTGASSALKGKRVAYYIVARKVSSAKSFDTKNTTQSEKITMIDSDESNYSDDTSVSFSGQTTERSKISTGGSNVKKSEQREYLLSDNQFLSCHTIVLSYFHILQIRTFVHKLPSNLHMSSNDLLYLGLLNKISFSIHLYRL